MSLEHNLYFSGFTPLKYKLCSVDTVVEVIALTFYVAISDSEKCFTNI